MTGMYHIKENNDDCAGDILKCLDLYEDNILLMKLLLTKHCDICSIDFSDDEKSLLKQKLVDDARKRLDAFKKKYERENACNINLYKDDFTEDVWEQYTSILEVSKKMDSVRLNLWLIDQ